MILARMSLMVVIGATTLLTGCEGSPVDLAGREDLSTARTVDLCFAADFSGVNSPERVRLLEEVRRRGEITDRELEAARQGKVFIGMSQTGAMCAWGPPDDINRTTFSFGVHEQWVYVAGQYDIPSNFLYFEDGRLTSIQN